MNTSSERFQPRNRRTISVLLTLIILSTLVENVPAQKGLCELIKIDAYRTWVSSFWRYNAPKLIFDGTTHYTIGLEGNGPLLSKGAICRWTDGNL